LTILESEAVKARLLEEARARAEEIVREAEAEAKRKIREAEALWRERAEKERRRIISEAEKEANNIVSDAVREARFIISMEVDNIVSDILSQAYNVIRSRGFDAKSSLKNLITESMKTIDSPRRLIVSRRDLETAREVVTELGLTGVSIEVGDIEGGIIVESASGIIVDNTYESRFKEFQNKYLNEIRRILWG
jgi:V/A-type H+-transporting ATPase subunit E